MLDNKLVQIALSAVMVSVTALCLYTPEIFIVKRGADFTVQIMFAFLWLGMLFLVLDKSRLMFMSLASCGVLCLYLISMTNQSMRFPNQNQNPQLSLAYIDLSLSHDYDEAMLIIRNADVDLISFQEYTPYWDNFLPQELMTLYPYQAIMTRIDPYGMAVYSKYPIRAVDTMNFIGFQETPSLHSTVVIDNDTELHIVSTHVLPPVNDEAYERMGNYFQEIGNYVGELDGPVITLGDFSLPSWSSEINEFKQYANLSDSRRDIFPRSSGNPIFLLNIPIDHIFYSNDIECTSFAVLSNENSSHLGLTGKYQLKSLASLSEELQPN